MAIAFRPTMSLGRPGVWTSPADHRGDAAVQIAIDPPELILAWRPIAADGMDVAVDEAGGKSRSFGIDGDGGSGSVDIFFFAHGSDAVAYSDHGVGVEDRIGKVSAKQQADVADDELDLWHRFRWFVVGHGSLPGTELLRT